MSVTVDVPKSIPLSKIRAFVEELGIDSGQLLEFRCGMSGVYVEVCATDADGRNYVIPGGNELATHRISIQLDVAA